MRRGRSRRYRKNGKRIGLAVLTAAAAAVLGAGAAAGRENSGPGAAVESSLAAEAGQTAGEEETAGWAAGEEMNGQAGAAEDAGQAGETGEESALEASEEEKTSGQGVEKETSTQAGASKDVSQAGETAEMPQGTEVSEGIFRSEAEYSETYPYGEFSAIHTGKAVLYENRRENARGITVCVNAGHGCAGGERQKTYCHPDKSPKVTSGTTAAGAVKSSAISGGMTFQDGTAEAEVTLAMALVFRDRLLSEGYSVLMIRETDDVQLDNVARTVLANELADCHIALHWDSTASDKGSFFMSVPAVDSYRAMEPVASHWEEHNRLGKALVGALKDGGNKIFSSGEMEMDLTQTSFSTIPSVDIELGDKASDHGEETLRRLADGLTDGVNRFFEDGKAES